MDASFATILWSIIIVTDIALALARMFMAPGTLRLSFALAIPILILLGALIYGTMFWSKRDKRIDTITEKGTALEYADEERDRPDRGVKTSPMN